MNSVIKIVVFIGLLFVGSVIECSKIPLVTLKSFLKDMGYVPVSRIEKSLSTEALNHMAKYGTKNTLYINPHRSSRTYLAMAYLGKNRGMCEMFRFDCPNMWRNGSVLEKLQKETYCPPVNYFERPKLASKSLPSKNPIPKF